MRKFLKSFLVCVLLVCCFSANATVGQAAAPSEAISPLYALTYKTKVSLSISSGIAACSSYVKASDTSSTVSITVKLCKKEGNSWVSVKSWSVQNQEYAAYVDETYSVSKGTYRLHMSGTVVSADGTIENVSGVSAEKTIE